MAKKTPPKMRVAIIGAGKVGASLARALKKIRWPVTLYSARKFELKKALNCDLLILAVRDRDLAPLAKKIAESGRLSKSAACVHVAGALSADVLAPLRDVCAGVAQMHPMISFASKTKPPRLANGHVHVKGDNVAEARAKKMARAIGMTPRTFE
ncbi:MAG: DUF2520 domain-containing protein, partial [Polyangiaceae bacterium]